MTWTLCTPLFQGANSYKKKLGQTYTVITFDQALYCRAKELIWFHQEDFVDVIIRLGGFHTAVNFRKAIGQYMDASGLKDVGLKVGFLGKTLLYTC